VKVSIITICYNSQETLEDTIKSVLAQDYNDLEYIIIDGDSKDNTPKIIEKYKNSISHVTSEPDKGIYDAMNKGVEKANGDLVGILNSDDFYANNSVISNIVAAINKNNSDSIYADLVYVDRLNPKKTIRTWRSGEYKHNLFLKGWMPPHPTFFVKKWVYEKYGKYNTSLKSAADYEFMLRVIHKHGISASYFPETITKMRTGGESNVSLNNRLRANREDRKAWKLNGLQPNLFTLIRKPLSKIKQFF
jgi:glycosyltransferase involved in cell wall biosynthesis